MKKTLMPWRMSARLWLCVLILAGLLWPATRVQAAWWSEDLKLVNEISNLPGNAVDLQVSDDRVYMMSELPDAHGHFSSANDRYISVINVDKPKRPKLLATWQPENHLQDFAVSGRMMFTAETSYVTETNYVYQESRINVLDMKDPESPRVTAHYQLDGPLQKMKAADSRLLLATPGKLTILDQSASVVGSLPLNTLKPYPWVFDLAVQGKRVFLLGASGVTIVNIGNPAEPFTEKFIPVNNKEWFSGMRLAVAEDKLFICNWPTVVVCKWTLAPEEAELTTYNTMMVSNIYYQNLGSVAVKDNTLFIPLGGQGVQAIDVSNVYSNDFMKGYFLTPGNAYALQAHDDYVYVATGRRGLTILKMDD